jgi:hypothetical protein
MSSTQELVVLTNVALISTISVVRIPSTPYMMHNEKLEKFKGLNFKM